MAAGEEEGGRKRLFREDGKALMKGREGGRNEEWLCVSWEGLGVKHRVLG